MRFHFCSVTSARIRARTWSWLHPIYTRLLFPLIYPRARFLREMIYRFRRAVKTAADRADAADECIGIILRGLKAKGGYVHSLGFSLTTLISLGSLFLPGIYPSLPPHRRGSRLLLLLHFLNSHLLSPLAFPPKPSCIFTGRRTPDLFPVGGRVISTVCLANYLLPRLRK